MSPSIVSLLAISNLFLAVLAAPATVTLTSSYSPKDLPWGKLFVGEWTTKADHLFGLYSQYKGLAGFFCYQSESRQLVTTNPETCRIVMYDGEWMDNEAYALTFDNSTFDLDRSTLEVHCNADLSTVDTKIRSVKLDGSIHFTTKDLVSMTASLRSEAGVRINFAMEEKTREALKNPIVKYSFIVTILAMCQLFAVLVYAKECSESDRIAKPVLPTQTSILFLLMNCIIDCGLWLWHMNLAFQYFYAFDYMIIGALWNMFVFLIVQKRLLPIVWLSQNRERFQMVQVTQGLELFTAEYNTYQNRFFLHVMVSVVVFFVFNDLYLLFTLVLHLFYVPQVVSNSLTRERNRIKVAIFVTLGVSRLLLVVTLMQMYIFGCPKNFLLWQPKDWFWLLMVLVMVGQMGILYLQNSRRRKWLFAEVQQDQQHDYYSVPSVVAPNQQDCVICLTPLSLPGVQRANVVNTSVTMRPPCGHLFHKDCLRNWMRIKLECPTCRGPLPRIDDDEDQYSD